MSKRTRRGEASSSTGQQRGKARNEGNDNPLGIIFRNQEHRLRFNALFKRKIVATKYIDEHALETLGIKDDVHWMFNNVGWEEFMSLHYPTYPRLTLEFLSSVEAEILQGRDCGEGRITFRLLNEEHDLNLEEFNMCYGLPLGGERRVHRNFNEGQVWNQLSIDNGRYDSSRSKSSALQNPVFRYIHRTMSKTIFGRGESDGVVRQSELMFLWAMLNSVNLDTGAHFIRHLVKMGNSASGDIVPGGLITHLALALGYDLTGLNVLEGSPTTIDLNACIAMKMISTHHGRFCLVLKNQPPLPLPNPELTTIRQPANWKMTNLGQHAPLPQPAEPAPHFAPEPARHSFAFGESSAGTSTWDFSDLRSSMNAIQDDLTTQKAYWEERSRIEDERYQRSEQFMTRAEAFFTQAGDYFTQEEAHRKRQEDQWRREEEHRALMANTSRQVDNVYSRLWYGGHPPAFPRRGDNPPR